MKLEEIEAMIEIDSKIDHAILDHESIKIPSLHSKYYKIFIGELRIMKFLDVQFHETKKRRTDYYLGRAPDQAYIDEPLDIKILKADLDLYLNADRQLNEIMLKREDQKMKVDMLEQFIKTLNNRSFNINNAINFMKFKNGIS